MRFLVLANSYKHHERCVAGYDLDGKNFVRLISNRVELDYAVPKVWCVFGGREIAALEVYEIVVDCKAARMGAQTENYLVSAGFIKRYLETKPANILTKLKNTLTPFGSVSNYLDEYIYKQKDCSISVVVAYNITFIRENDSYKASFDVYKYNHEKLKLTNYDVTDRYYRFNEDRVGKAVLIVTLPPSSISTHYNKFISSIIPLE